MVSPVILLIQHTTSAKEVGSTLPSFKQATISNMLPSSSLIAPTAFDLSVVVSVVRSPTFGSASVYTAEFANASDDIVGLSRDTVVPSSVSPVPDPVSPPPPPEVMAPLSMVVSIVAGIAPTPALARFSA